MLKAFCIGCLGGAVLAICLWIAYRHSQSQPPSRIPNVSSFSMTNLVIHFRSYGGWTNITLRVKRAEVGDETVNVLSNILESVPSQSTPGDFWLPGEFETLQK